MSEKDFEDKRNAEYDANKAAGKITTDKIVGCSHCDYQPTSYMDWVKHREKKHGIPRGKADEYNG